MAVAPTRCRLVFPTGILRIKGNRYGRRLTRSKTVDIILAWLIAEDDGAKKKITALLADRDEDLSVIRHNIQGKFRWRQTD